jgi:hypothetical protein
VTGVDKSLLNSPQQPLKERIESENLLGVDSETGRIEHAFETPHKAVAAAGNTIAALCLQETDGSGF